MADEKTLFNKKNSENPEKEEQQLHSIAVEKDLEYVDLSSAFDDEDDVDEEYEEELEDYRPAPSLFRGFSFFRRKKESDKDISPVEIEDEVPKEVEEKEEIQAVKEGKEESLPEKNKKKKNKKKKDASPVKEEAEKPSSKDVADSENSVSEEIKEEITEEAEVELLPDFEESTQENENPVEELKQIEENVEEKPEEQPTEERVEETATALDDEEEDEVEIKLIFDEDSEDETEEVVEKSLEEAEEKTPANEQKFEKRRFGGFGFLKRKLMDSPVDTEEPEKVEEAVEETTEEPEIEMLPSFEEAEQEAESAVEETEEVTVETTEEPEIEMLPSFEEAEQESEISVAEVKQVEETNETENSTEEVEEVSLFEVTVEEKVTEPPAEEPIEEIELIPPFEATVEADTAEEQPETKKKKKEKKAKKVDDSEEEQVEQSNVTLMTTKDHLTFILIILALLLTIVFIVVKFIPLGNEGAQGSNVVTQAKEKVSEIQLQRESAVGHYIQSDIDNVFYVYSTDYVPAFYQYKGNKMKAIKTTGALNPVVEIGNDKISVKVDYVEIDDKLFGTGVFQKNNNQGNSFNNMIVFKLVNLPKGYEQKGKALLLATNNSEAVSKRCSMWNDSYIVDLTTGKTTRFLTSDNSVYSAAYSLLTDEGYASVNGEIPFFSTRDYDVTTNKRDIYLKVKGKETRFATDVAGSFVYTDAGVVSYLKVVDDGFNVVRKEKGKEKVIFSLDGNTSYLYHNEYLLDKFNGNLYNVKTGEKIVVTGYGMSNPEMMTVSPDGKYLVVIGAVNSAIDYQVHIFDLKSGNCAKYVDDNFSQHRNLTFIDKTTVIYSAVEPKQGYEYVILDVSKAF